MTSRKEMEREHRRQLLLEAAARVFGRKPFDEATIQEVAAEAEIGIQGLYEHFPSKQEIYEQVMDLRAAHFRRSAEIALGEAGSEPLDRLRILARVYVQQFQDRPFSLPMFARDRVSFDFNFDCRFRKHYEEIYQAERQRLVTILGEGVAAGDLVDLDPEFLAQLCMDVFQASLHHSHPNLDAAEVEVCVERALACLLNGIIRRR